MSATRLHVPHLRPGRVHLAESDRHYLVRVRRLPNGATLEVFDGAGHLSQAQLILDAAGEAWLEVGPLRDAPLTLPVTLGVAPPKGDRADWLVEKATELGVDTLVWLECERGVVSPTAQGSKVSRWERLAAAAARQAGRAEVPRLEGPETLADFFARPADLRLVCDRQGEPASSFAAATPGGVSIIVGPEGGLTVEEVAAAERAGYRRLWLGPYVLRVETAAVGALACVQSARAVKANNPP